jgi:DNA-directed RNA polymerase specialized sigma24 family protein
MVMRATVEATGAHLSAGSSQIRDPDGKRLVADCLAGVAVARARFQEQFGPLIYSFVGGGGGQPPVEPGDFYVYLFEDDRLFRRLRSYEGRASLAAFLRGFVLPDLLKRFRATVKDATLDTVPLDSDRMREPLARTADDEPQPLCGSDLLDQLTPEKRLLIKLLYIEDFDLEPDDVQLIAQRSGRLVREVVELIEQARESVRTRERKRRAKVDEAESAAQWILQYARRLHEIAETLGNLPPQSQYAERLRDEQAELERKHSWRAQQRDRARTEGDRTTVTLRYREIAHILKAPTGSVSAQVMRLRQELLTAASKRQSHQ